MSPETENRRGSSGANTDATSTSNKRRRTSDRFSLTVPDQPDADYVRSSSTPMALTRTSPHPGSSRDMTPPEGSGSLKYTRTGRVSKATKGQRVHHCEECGKVSCSRSFPLACCELVFTPLPAAASCPLLRQAEVYRIADLGPKHRGRNCFADAMVQTYTRAEHLR